MPGDARNIPGADNLDWRLSLRSLPRDPEEYRRWWAEQRPDIPYGLCWCGCGERTSIASTSTYSRNCVAGEPRRYLPGHNTPTLSDIPYAEEACGYITDCWVWRRGKDTSGYGTIRHDGKDAKAHRVFYERKHGPLPGDLELDHLCAPFGGRRCCVNPDHLEPVIHAENARRGRSAKLTAAQVEEMRRLRAKEGLSYMRLGRLFGVSATQAGNIVSRKQWR